MTATPTHQLAAEHSSATTGWLTGKTALITGGGSGIGRAVAERYLREGAQVVIFGREQSKLDEVVAHNRGLWEFPEPGGAAAPSVPRMLAVAGDVRSTEDLHSAVRTTVETFGRLDIVVPNAGIWDYNRSVSKLDGQELASTFDELFAVNVKGYLLTVEASWRALVESHGSIVMTLSNASFYTAGGGSIYTASKFACRGLVQQFAYELAPKVRVNGVAVGAMNTDLRGPASIGLKDRALSESFKKSTITGNNPLIPLHEASVDPQDFTGSYVLLASEANSGNITGQIIQVDGGIGVRGFGTQAAGGDNL